MNLFSSFQAQTGMDRNLLIALWAMGGFVTLLFLSLWYMAYRTRQVEFNHFVAMLADRELEEDEIKKLFKALKKTKKEPHLLLESEEVMKEVVKVAKLDEKKLRVKLGFDTDSLIEKFLKQQEELRKIWNAR
ncbi:MAG: hypothetical protein GXO61_00480 [Epsilonproteobacteria bacterium]|nr:hypothetical protein [Campylobacterota bacterium]